VPKKNKPKTKHSDIKILRASRRLTQTAMAKMLTARGIPSTQADVSEVENGVTNARFEAMLEILKGMDKER